MISNFSRPGELVLDHLVLQHILKIRGKKEEPDGQDFYVYTIYTYYLKEVPDAKLFIFLTERRERRHHSSGRRGAVLNRN